MISEEQQDQAALYALGLLDADEAAAFEHAQEADGELGTLAMEFREAAANLARTDTDQVEPPAGLRARVLTSVAAEAAAGDPATGKVVAFPQRRRTWVPWTAAAALAACCAALGALCWGMIQEGIGRGDTLRLATRRAQSAEAALAAERGGALGRVAYCALESVPAAQQTGPQAAVLWDAASRRGRLQIFKLPPAGTDKDYQLWTVEDGHKNPISAGVVKVNATGGATVDFQPGEGDDAQAAVTAFALSVERAGGVPKNEGPILFLGKLSP